MVKYRIIEYQTKEEKVYKIEHKLFCFWVDEFLFFNESFSSIENATKYIFSQHPETKKVVRLITINF